MATAKKVLSLFPKEQAPDPPQEKYELAEPESNTDLRDNIDLLLTDITDLFEALEEYAGLGVDLCAELKRHIGLLDHAQ